MSGGKGLSKDESDSVRAAPGRRAGAQAGVVRSWHVHLPRRAATAGPAAAVAWYTLARLGLVAVIAALLVLAGVPLLLALLVGLVVALPLSMVLFRGLRARLDAAIAEVPARRAAERSELRARLRGDAPDGPEGAAGPPETASDDRAQREPDPGRG